MPDTTVDADGQTTPIVRVAVVGTGVLGSQIAFQAALYGYQVAVFDSAPSALKNLPAAFARIERGQRIDVGADPAALARAAKRIHSCKRLAETVADSDLVIETISENRDAKVALLTELGSLIPAETIVVSSSSGLVPSELAGHLSNPQRYLHVHFANRVWLHNTAEIMSGPATSAVARSTAVEFARSIGMLPILLEKEHRGYVGDALLAPSLDAALRLVLEGIATVETVDKHWMITRETAYGPFAMCDFIGFRTMLTRAEMRYEQDPSENNAEVVAFWRRLIAEGRLGEASGQGFYSYPEPAWSKPDFLL